MAVSALPFKNLHSITPDNEKKTLSKREWEELRGQVIEAVSRIAEGDLDNDILAADEQDLSRAYNTYVEGREFTLEETGRVISITRPYLSHLFDVMRFGAPEIDKRAGFTVLSGE